ncbi:MAG TPA: hypothetical protein VNS32_08190 [Flavisolibacter sp.]|nr:hypothetical protein [Flavisolibacter sp.]
MAIKEIVNVLLSTTVFPGNYSVLLQKYKLQEIRIDPSIVIS